MYIVNNLLLREYMYDVASSSCVAGTDFLQLNLYAPTIYDDYIQQWENGRREQQC